VGIKCGYYRDQGLVFRILRRLFNSKASEGLVPVLKRVALVYTLKLDIPLPLYAAAQAAEVDLVAV
jgi:hypothetical protein